MHDDEDSEPVAYVRLDRHDWIRRAAWRGGFIHGICVGVLLFYGVEIYRSFIS